MPVMLIAFEWILSFATVMLEGFVYVAYATWATLVQGTFNLLDLVDEYVEDVDIVDNSLLRMLVMGLVGFVVGVGLMIFLLLATGNWSIPCLFFLFVGFCLFLGLMADPDQNWRVGTFDEFRRGGGPRTPLNL